MFAKRLLSITAVCVSVIGLTSIGSAALDVVHCRVGVTGTGYGTTVADVGDVTGTGGTKILAGANGYADVLDGDDCTLVWRHYVQNPSLDEGFGRTVAGIGDLNHDSRTEIVIGGDDRSTHVCLFYGSDALASIADIPAVSGTPGLAIINGHGIPGFGSALCTLGDLNGDGTADFVIGSPGENKVYVISGQTLASIMTIDGTDGGGGFGAAVWGGEAVGDPAKPDLLVGAPEFNRAGQVPGRVYVFKDLTLTSTLNANTFAHTIIEGDAPANSGFGSTVEWDFDLNGDGANNIVIGAPRQPNASNNPLAGAVYALAALPTSSSQTTIYVTDPTFWLIGAGAASEHYFGSAIAGIEDFNGDGIPDIAVGVPLTDYVGVNSGTVYICSGNQSSPGTLTQQHGEAGEYAFGSDVALLRINNDICGWGLIIGESGYGAGFNHNGRVDKSCLAACNCPYQCDFDENGFLDANDLNDLIDVLFFGDPDPQDVACPTTRGDFNDDGFSDALDLNALIGHLFFAGVAPAEPCAP